MSDESEKPFTVSDRRHFTPDGRPRDESDPAADTPQPAAAEAEGGQTTPPGPEASSAEAGPAPAPQPEPPASARRPRPSAGPIEFRDFILSLGAQAGLLLSAPGEGEGPDDEAAALEGARQIIAILEMLQDKTEGRRTTEESRALEDVLFQLRMAYVERSRSGRR